MIEFSRQETKVVIQIKHGIWFGNQHFELTINQSQEYQAELLKRQLNEHMRKQLKRIRKEAYEQGWKEAKAKTKKRNCYDDFDGTW